MAGLHGEMKSLSLKQHRLKITERLEKTLEKGDLKGMETNSNYIEFWYWMTYNNLKVTINGEEFGLDKVGKLAKTLDNGETVRTIWSKMRRDLKKKLDLEAQQQFKQEFGIDK